MRPSLCIVVPVLNEIDLLERRLRALAPLRERGARVVVVDGGSSDASLYIARRHADLAIVSPRGRASQMNAGAAACPADIYLFLHADTALPPEADKVISRAMRAGSLWGRFDVCIGSSDRRLLWIGAAMNLYSRLTGVCTGAHALFVHHEAFTRVGGFPEIELLEDIAMCRDLKRFGRPACLRDIVITSPRQWETAGVLHTLFVSGILRLAFFLGVSPARLANVYRYGR